MQKVVGISFNKKGRVYNFNANNHDLNISKILKERSDLNTFTLNIKDNMDDLKYCFPRNLEPPNIFVKRGEGAK